MKSAQKIMINGNNRLNREPMRGHRASLVSRSQHLRLTLIFLISYLSISPVWAQISIGGNVYGGGNAGDTDGSTRVVIRSGDIDGSVFGGARQANVTGSAFVNIDGEHISGDILINYVYGGNDIAGTIGASATIPAGITEAEANGITEAATPTENTKNYNAFVLTTKERTPKSGEQQYHAYIGQLFGGGNGDYDYTTETSAATYYTQEECDKYNTDNNLTSSDEGYITTETIKTPATTAYVAKSGNTTIATSATEFVKPNLGKTYIEMRGGSCVILYGGGNNVTVNQATDICIDNPSEITTAILDSDGNNKLEDDARLKRMGCYALGGAGGFGSGYVTSDAYQFSRVFGGNNKAEMAIRPRWHLKQGKIRNLYSGGNRGAMTFERGIFLSIKEEANPDPDSGFMGLVVGNIYGGCRMADVNPDKRTIYQEEIEGVLCPPGYAARLNIAGGTIGNVYGGNAVGIHSSINGDVYGGGNGSYPYTDNSDFRHVDGVEDSEAASLYGDFYYNPDEVLREKGITPAAGATDGMKSVMALNEIRPNAEAVSVRLISDNPAKPTIIGGSVFCGGNSATLHSLRSEATAELKIGSYVYADKVFLGSNGENMVTEAMLKQIAGDVTIEGERYDFSQINLTVQAQMDEYMKGCEMNVRPNVVFDKVSDGGTGYQRFSTYFGSLYCGGNVGSVNIPGMNTLNFDQEFVIFNKLVGGCNTANVPVKYDDDGTTALNAAYYGGLIAAPDGDGNKLTLNLSGLKIQPMRWAVERNDDYTRKLTDGKETYLLTTGDHPHRYLEWNTIYASTGAETEPVLTGLPSDGGKATDEDLDRRFTGASIYGGCYSSGHINGNVVININSTLVDRDKLFDVVSCDKFGEEISLYGSDQSTQATFEITERKTGVILAQQGMDVLGKALNVFGGGKGKDTEIWGSTTINMNAGYIFQVFGGSEEGVIGKHITDGDGADVLATQADGTYDTGNIYHFNGLTYQYDDKYSCYVNLKGTYPGVTKSDPDSNADMAECEFLYGGGFLGPIAGNTIINLGNGRIFNSFAGSCNADILGHTETYLGRQINETNKNLMGKLGHVSEGVCALDDDNSYDSGFPWVRDITYGGNDLGGRILGVKDFTYRVRPEALGKVYKYNASSNPKPEQLTASAYTEYLQGRAEEIFGGCYGTYDYSERRFTDIVAYKPFFDNAFVNFRPTYSQSNNMVNKVFGAGQGIDQTVDENREGDLLQNRSYVLVDVPASFSIDNKGVFESTEFFGGGSFNGLGMNYTQAKTQPETGTFDLDRCSAIIDLVRGKVGNAYGGSYNEGIVRRTLLNVPEGSTIDIKNIFGGGYGRNIMLPCDVYEAHVNYHSEDATVRNNIYGGNNNGDRTLYSQINIDVPVWQDRTKGYQATVFGAGCGVETWSQYTEVNLLPGAQVFEVYGGGENGRVLNKETLDKWQEQEGQALDLRLHEYEENGLNNILVKETALGLKYNTNVHIHRGAIVGNYAYGGGLGDSSIEHSGDVYGTTYIDLLGGIVKKDIYAAGTTGSVRDGFQTKAFTAGATAYIAGGSCRNVYGGGWKGSVGRHTKMTNVYQTDENGDIVNGTDGNPIVTGEIEVDADINDPATGDIAGETHVVIGIRDDQPEAQFLAAMTAVKGSTATANDYGFYCGLPTIQRNAYGGGEGGAVYGTASLTLNNGYIGYEYNTGSGAFEEKVNDETYYEQEKYAGDGRLRDCGNVFGGGYDARSSVDESNVVMWNGEVRGSLHGGGEIATIGRGSTQESGEVNSTRIFQAIYQAGKTFVDMYNGHVHRNVFGGGKGYNLLGYGSNSDLYTDGYTFGKTEVHIHGGEVGTDEGLADGYGNIFGGGDLGYVYSTGYTASKSINENTTSPGHIYYYDKTGADKKLIEDCKVVVSPYLQTKTACTINGNSYAQYAYVTTDDLNTLPKKNDAGRYDGDWQYLYTGDRLPNGDINPDDPVERGVHIHNAVFGGGNVASNTDTHYANATTVFGNTTATLYDVYHRDFITVGTEHTGGIYGGGNLSMVDGYRELNITNYGTDYYGLTSRITLEEYKSLSNRERAYFQLEYVCTGTSAEKDGKLGVYVDGTFYANGERVKEDDYNKMKNKDGFVASEWEQFGFCSIYAGRLLNTIQRADLCGVYGSRMVLQGAKDRVADVGENVDFTINRVGELSLNRQNSLANDTGEDAYHGNYFGIYSIVNHLGNLTSDVRFNDTYVNSSGNEEGGKTYYSYKAAAPKANSRNYGKSHNQVALASGVFLELTTENSTADHKDYGYITGVIELDLINVKFINEGGGFVYAKNEHRVPVYYPDKKNVILSEYNLAKTVNNAELRDEICTYKRYRYSGDNESEWSSAGTGTVIQANETVYALKEYQTSGNFIHPSPKKIVDDCYPYNNSYDRDLHNPYSEAHYWYIKGSVYIYDQVLSAYTGSASAYSKSVHLPLTITAASNGRLELQNVKPNLYAYYYQTGKKIGTGDNDGKVWVNNNAAVYQLNDVINWWDYSNLPDEDKHLFVSETYVNCVACKIDGTDYAVGEYVMLPTDIAEFKAAGHTIRDLEGKALIDKDGNDYANTDALIDDVFRSSNNLGHISGYVLTFDMDSPKVWDDYYTKEDSDDKITKEEYNNGSTVKTLYLEGPTFSPKTTGVYGDRYYNEDQIVTKTDYDNFALQADKEKVQPAYVAKEAVTYYDGSKTKTINAGTAISSKDYDFLASSDQADKRASFDRAWVCTNTLELAENTYLLLGDLKTAAEIAQLKLDYSSKATEIGLSFDQAYICIEAGNYGGRNYLSTNNYTALNTWCTLSKDDRIDAEGNDKFIFNYDALDLFADPDYLKTKSIELAYHSPYSDEVAVEYKAKYNDNTTREIRFNNGSTKTFSSTSDAITNAEFENVRNDKRYYTRITTGLGVTTAYVATQTFTYNGVPYGKGQVVDKDVYDYNSPFGYVEQITVPANATTYYCYQNSPYTTEGTKLTSTQYSDLINDQQYFVIQGKEPTETTTLYVNRESDIKDVTTEKIITVVYRYTYYEEEDGTGDEPGGYKLTNELHVVNIHLQLESGTPTIGKLENPPTVLPGDAVGMKAPVVKPGTYEVLTNGWELFNDENDAQHHRNGKDFKNNSDPVYWYQNGDHYIAFYSKTYLGKTYSNYVPLSVANYHDLADVMENHKDNHLYIDRSDVDRPCKVYINNYSNISETNKRTDSNGVDNRVDKNGLDELRALYDLSLFTSTSPGVDNGMVTADGALKDHSLLDSHIKSCANLDIILRTDLSATADASSSGFASWTPLGNDDNPCFSGNIHGDGHTISNLDHSFVNKLCGNIYNLGVTGSFTGAGVAETGDGFVENCWIKTSATSGFSGITKAVFGDPTATNCTQLVNCYYPEAPLVPVDPEDPASLLAPLTTYYADGPATKMPDKAFYDGTVAYNLNGFYLGKRYYDGTNLVTGEQYGYIKANVDGSLTMTTDGEGNTLDVAVAQSAYYPTAQAWYEPQKTTLTPKLGYVEHRYYDGDFRYADGTIPENFNIRRQENIVTVGSEEVNDVTWIPIWPDDYLFFGQTLTYGYLEGNGVAAANQRPHQPLPSVITKGGDTRLVRTAQANRVYRAPAYYRNSTMSVAHFNPAAVFADQNSDGTQVVHKGMTAIDFSGGNGDLDGGYAIGFAQLTQQSQQPQWTHSDVQTSFFYPPLLDDDGLTDFSNIGLTRNLLAYTFAKSEDGVAAATAGEMSANVVSYVLHDYSPTWGTATGTGTSTDHYVTGKEDYKTVAHWDRASNWNSMYGHWVQLNGTSYMAPLDHFLVDEQDFNAPMAYTFAEGKRMWYQRTPSLYVSIDWVDDDSDDSTPLVRTTKGWQDISLPFKVETVTTNVKGELTHFYNAGSSSKYGTKGHEYWLRQFEGGTIGGTTENPLFKAKLNYPDATTNSSEATYPDASVASGATKEYTNTFLWDYYYSYNSYDDAHLDDYQEKDEDKYYYKTAREYDNYPRMAAATPYLIGFPGKQYYEFDLSGEFTPANTIAEKSGGWPSSRKLSRQVVTFASATGTTIGVSDNDIAAATAKDGYTFRPSYLNEEIAAGTDSYVLNATGSQYDKVPATGDATTVSAFRPYFVKGSGSGSSRQMTRSIVFVQDEQLEQEPQESLLPGTISARPGRHKINVTYHAGSNPTPVTVRIIAPSGLCVATFDLQPGESRDTHIVNSGVYIVQADGFIKKLSVK